MKSPILLTALAAAALLAGCNTAPTTTARAEPTYQEAASAPFLQSSRDAITKLTAGFDLGTLDGGPVLVATIVNVNDLSRSAPLGRTLSEQYASHMAATGFNVKEVKLRGDVFVKEGTGELLLSREIKDIARNHNASLVLVGTYSAAASYTYVSLKLVRTEDSRIVRGYDYALPNDRDVQRLLAVAR
jgi:curli biogenesis system outer membrane secretion channel CsgG